MRGSRAAAGLRSRTKKLNEEREGCEGCLPCPVCGGLMLQNGLTKHYRKHIEHHEAPGAKPWICSYCAVTFWTEAELNEHRKAEGHRKKRKKYPPKPKTPVADKAPDGVGNKERYEHVLRADRAHRGDYEGFLAAIGVRRQYPDRSERERSPALPRAHARRGRGWTDAGVRPGARVR